MVLREERPGATPGAASSPTRQPAQAGQGTRLIASPLARRLAKQLGLDLADMAGSGPHGRIVERDVRAAEVVGPKPKAVPAAAPAASGKAPDVRLAAAPASDETIKTMFEPGSYTEVPHDGMRKTIARPPRRGEADDPAFLPDRRLQARCADGAARADQRGRPKGQGGQAGLQGLGQRLHHQGAGARLTARAGGQCHLDRGRDAAPPAQRHRRRRVDPRRPDHAGDPQGRAERRCR